MALSAVFLLTALTSVTGCVAKVYTPLALSQPEAIVAALPKTDLRVGFYMEPAAKNFAIDEYWIHLKVGEAVDAKVDEYFPKMFKTIRHLKNFPPPTGSVDDLDLLITVDYADGRIQNTARFAWSTSLSTKFNVYTPDHKVIRTMREDSKANFFMGSLNPMDNMNVAYETADVVSSEVVLNFLREFPLPEISEAVRMYRQTL